MNETLTGASAADPPAEAEETVAQKRSIRWSTFVVWGAVLAILGLLGWGLINANQTRPEAGVVAPSEFEMEFFDGYQWQDMSVASLEDMKGNVVVLNFWASWCVECRVEADLLESAWRQYRDRGVVFLGVAYVDSEAKSLAYLEQYGISYPNAPDLGSAISDEYEITGVPETFIIDREGVIADVVIGPVNASRLYGQLDRLVVQ